jgi:tyrosinase
MNIRKNVWELGDDWADPILWYARAVADMQTRPLADPTSWRFYGAMHGIDAPLWQLQGYLAPGEPQPATGVSATFWSQCQHGTWYFLPWHRGYLLMFEANVRATVVKLGGPADWTLPYWNYFKTGQSALPPAFAARQTPDGTPNALYVAQRFGPNNDGNVYVDLSQVTLNALGEGDFTGPGNGGSPGFGGVDTGFEHGGNTHGDLESQPHDMVHVLVGGQDPSGRQLPGLMSDPDTAGLDPIFWLHHANIDRLWEVWLQQSAARTDPSDANWSDGPARIGERPFVMPQPDASTWTYTPAGMTDLSQLGYTYDDFTPAGAPAPAIAPGPPPAPAALSGIGGGNGGAAVEPGKNVELVGASQGRLNILGSGAATSVKLDPATRQKVTATFAAAVPEAERDRVFLNLENVTGLSDATRFNVYIGVPQSADPSDHPERLAGSVALFGVRKASKPDGDHAGAGLNFVLDITRIASDLHLEGDLEKDAVDVRIVPARPVTEAAHVSVGRISLYRQGR